MLLQCIDLCLFIQKIFIEHLLYVSTVLGASKKTCETLWAKRLDLPFVDPNSLEGE